jgi:hypothetical protein
LGKPFPKIPWGKRTSEGQRVKSWSKISWINSRSDENGKPKNNLNR